MARLWRQKLGKRRSVREVEESKVPQKPEYEFGGGEVQGLQIVIPFFKEIRKMESGLGFWEKDSFCFGPADFDMYSGP